MASNNNQPPNDLLRARLAFLQRAREQLTAKRNNLVILRDIEKFFYDEQNFYILMKRNLNAIANECPPEFNLMQEDFDKVDKDFALTNKWRIAFTTERASKIREINAIEADFPARPDFRVEKIVTYSDDLFIKTNQQVPELQYRIRQAFIYVFQLIAQHCCHQLPPNQPPTPTTTVTQFQHGGEQFEFRKLGFGQFSLDKPIFTGGPLETRLPSRDYIFAINRQFWEEIERYVQMYVEESIFLGPKDFQSDEFVPFIPFLPRDKTQ